MIKRIIFAIIVIVLVVLGAYAYKAIHNGTTINTNTGNSNNQVNGQATSPDSYINDSIVDPNYEPDLGNLS